MNNELKGSQRTAIALNKEDGEFYEWVKENRSLFYSDLVRMGLQQVRMDRMTKKAKWLAEGYLSAKMSFYKRKKYQCIYAVKLDFGENAKLVKPVKIYKVEDWGNEQYMITYKIDGIMKESKVQKSIVAEEILDLQQAVALAADKLNKESE